MIKIQINNYLFYRYKMNNRSFTLPGSGRKIIINFDQVIDLDLFISQFGQDFTQYKHQELSWQQYGDYLNSWLQNGTIDEINKSGREDLRWLWIKYKNAVIDNDSYIPKIITKEEQLRRYTIDDANQFMADGRVNILEGLANIGVLPNNVGIIGAIQNLNILSLEWAFQHGIFPSFENVNLAIELGNLDILRWLFSHRFYPDSAGITIPVNSGNLRILDLFAEFNLPPSVEDANLAVRNEDLEVLEWLEDYNIFPNADGANMAVRIGNIEILEFLEEHDIFPTQEGANIAIETNNPQILRWLINHHIFPTVEATNYVVINENNIFSTVDTIYQAVMNENMEILNLLASLDPPILPNNDVQIEQLLFHLDISLNTTGANNAIKLPSIFIVKWLANRQILPNFEGANYSLSTSLTILRWLIDRHIYPTAEAIDDAVENDHTSGMEELVLHNPPILPTVKSANFLIADGQFRLLQLLESRGILPDVEGANNAVNDLESLEWLASRNIFPDSVGVDNAIRRNNKDNLRWLVSRNILPTSMGANYAIANGDMSMLYDLEQNFGIIPDYRGANIAASNDNMFFLRDLAKKSIYPTVQGMNNAILENHLNVLEWGESQNAPILPDSIGANNAVSEENYIILNWLAERNIFPNVEGANDALSYDDFDMMEWLISQNPPILPDIRGINRAIENKNFMLLDWLMSQNISNLRKFRDLIDVATINGIN
jgi:hypothetical protein